MKLAENVFIVGAGFSFNAGVPLAGSFNEAMLRPSTPLASGDPNEILNDAIVKFVDDVFGNGASVPPNKWPPLEDIFTTIDLAANTGHNLGSTYSASALRTMRRTLIVRFIRMLRLAYKERHDEPDANWNTLEELISSVDIDKTAFLSLNWDTVLEAGLWRTQKIRDFDYGCDASPAQFVESAGVRHYAASAVSGRASILKPHGSVNWMYCDCCSRLYWFKPSQTVKIASRLYKETDRKTVGRLLGVDPRIPTEKALCPDCGAEALGTRFATFSYRKALDFTMHLATWREAERQLRQAKNWIFIGYSMPAADYEFKFLLKRVQLSRTTPPNVIVVTAGGVNGATANAYRAFFGPPTIVSGNIHADGLDASVLTALRVVGALKDPTFSKATSSKTAPSREKAGARKKPAKSSKKAASSKTAKGITGPAKRKR